MIKTETTREMSNSFRDWWANHHPFDWWANKRRGESLPYLDRLLVAELCESAYNGGADAERARAAIRGSKQ